MDANRFPRWSLLLCLVVATACGGDKSDGASIGAAGGTVTSGDGLLSLTIPAGALPHDATIQLLPASDASDPLLIAGTGYRIKAPDVTLTAPATLTLSLAHASTAAAPSHSAQAITTVGACAADTTACTYVFDSDAPSCPADHPALANATLSSDSTQLIATCDLAPPSEPTLVSLTPGVTLPPSTYDTTSLTISSSIAALGNILIGGTLDTTPPVINFSYTVGGQTGNTFGTPVPLPSSTTVVFHANVTDNVGVDRIQVFLIGAHDLTGQAMAIPFAVKQTVNGATLDYSFVFDQPLEGVYHYVIQARDLAHNTIDYWGPDIIARNSGVVVQPVVSLVASSTSVSAAGDVTLTATASDNDGIAKVEFFEGATKLGEDTTPPYTQTVSYTSADNGSHTYFAKASDTLANTNNSNNVSVNVSIGVASTYDYYVDPVAGDDTHDGLTAGTAFKTICKAHDVIGSASDKVIGLLDGTYDGTNQRPSGWSLNAGCGPSFSVSATMRAVNPGQAVLEVSSAFHAGGALIDVKLDSQSNYVGQVSADGGTFSMSGVSYGDLSSSPSGLFYPVSFMGSVVATVTPNGLSNYFTTSFAATRGITAMAIGGSAQVTVNGGTYDDTALAQGGDNSYCDPLFSLQSQAQLTLTGVTVRHYGQLANGYITTPGGSITINGNSVLENHSTHGGNLQCTPFIQIGYQTNFLMEGSTIRGTAGGSGGSAVGVYTDGTSTGTITVNDSHIENFVYTSNGGVGIIASGNGTTASTVTIGNGTVFSGNSVALDITGHSNVSVHDSTFDSNVQYGVRATSTLATVDLGTSGTPGNNTFTGNGTSSVLVSAALTVDAAGNTWTPNNESSDGSGHYAAGLHDGPANGLNYTLSATGDKIQF